MVAEGRPGVTWSPRRRSAGLAPVGSGALTEGWEASSAGWCWSGRVAVMGGGPCSSRAAEATVQAAWQQGTVFSAIKARGLRCRCQEAGGDGSVWSQVHGFWPPLRMRRGSSPHREGVALHLEVRKLFSLQCPRGPVGHWNEQGGPGLWHTSSGDRGATGEGEVLCVLIWAKRSSHTVMAVVSVLRALVSSGIW